MHNVIALRTDSSFPWFHLQAANSLALGTSPIVRALVDPEGGMRSVRALDNVSFTDWFKSHGGSEGSIRRMWDPIAYALGFLNCDQVCTQRKIAVLEDIACWKLVPTD